MSTTTADYFTTIAQQGQDASRAAADAWVRAVQGTSVRLPSVASVAAAHEVIDQMSDLAISLVNVQRSLAKQYAETVVGATENAVRQLQETAASAGNVTAE